VDRTGATSLHAWTLPLPEMTSYDMGQAKSALSAGLATHMAGPIIASNISHEAMSLPREETQEYTKALEYQNSHVGSGVGKKAECYVERFGCRC
jgi:hypothetical protein